MNKIIGIAVLVIGVGGLIAWGLQDAKQEAVALDNNRTIYFYGEGCPHCKVVNDFLEENKVAEKVVFEKLEVWRNTANARLMSKAASQCGLASSETGVPFLFSEGRCLVGEPDVIGFFKEKAGIE